MPVNHLAKGGHGWAGFGRLGQQSGRGSFAEATVRGGYMVGHSHMAMPTGRTDMTRNPLTALEYLDRLAFRCEHRPLV